MAARFRVKVKKVNLKPGYTAVLLPPQTGHRRRARGAGASAQRLIASRPAGERIALYRWWPICPAICQFLPDRAGSTNRYNDIN